MNCRDSESLILAERDGVLTKERRAALSDHLAVCPVCAQFRTNLTAALDAYQGDLAAVTVHDANIAWRDLQAKLRGPKGKSPRTRPLAPVIWLTASLAAAAAIAIAFFVTRPTTSTSPGELAFTPPPYDPSIIAGADFVEAGDPNASTMVFVDKESGWLVVWATDVDTKTSG